MFTKDHKAYDEASQPHESIDAANEALAKFREEFKALRVKYKLQEVGIVVQTNAVSDGIKVPLMTDMTFGDPFNAEALFAFGIGSARKDRQALIAKLMAGTP